MSSKIFSNHSTIQILRVAAINHASYEWIHHETIGRKEGLSTGQLYVIRDTKTPLPSLKTILTPLQIAAIIFADHSTRDVRVPMDVIQEFKRQLKIFVASGNPSTSNEDFDAEVDDFFVETAMVVASYNMVSRFLLATDVGGISDMEVPWPVDKKEVSVFQPFGCFHVPPLLHLMVALKSQIDEYFFCRFHLDYYLNYALPELE